MDIRTVLIVEDSPSQREMMAHLLQSGRLTVMTASNGVEALEQVQLRLPDLIILDVVMPQMNGYEVCRRLKSDPKTHHLPILMCSSKAEDFDRYWGLKQGADAYIEKPFEPMELVTTVKNFLRF